MQVELYDKVYTNFFPEEPGIVVYIMKHSGLCMVYYPELSGGYPFWSSLASSREYIKANFSDYNEYCGSYWVTQSQINHVISSKIDYDISPVCRKIKEMEQRRKEQGYAF